MAVPSGRAEPHARLHTQLTASGITFRPAEGRSQMFPAPTMGFKVSMSISCVCAIRGAQYMLAEPFPAVP